MASKKRAREEAMQEDDQASSTREVEEEEKEVQDDQLSSNNNNEPTGGSSDQQQQPTKRNEKHIYSSVVPKATATAAAAAPPPPPPTTTTTTTTTEAVAAYSTAQGSSVPAGSAVSGSVVSQKSLGGSFASAPTNNTTTTTTTALESQPTKVSDSSFIYEQAWSLKNGGAKPFRCRIGTCEKRYKLLNGLISHHYATHVAETGSGGGEDSSEEMDKKFICGVCGDSRRYKNSGGLAYHIDTYHFVNSNPTNPPPAATSTSSTAATAETTGAGTLSSYAVVDIEKIINRARKRTNLSAVDTSVPPHQSLLSSSSSSSSLASHKDMVDFANGDGDEGDAEDDDADALHAHHAATASSSISREGGVGGSKSSDKVFFCPFKTCGKSYKNSNGLAYHFSKSHPEDIIYKGEMYQCPFNCGQTSGNLNTLASHMRRKHPNTQISTTLKNSNASSSLSSTSYFPANNSKASGDVVAFYEEGTSRTVGIHHASGGNSSHPSPNHNRHQEHTDLEDGEDGEEDGNYQGMGERKESAESSSSWNSMSSSYECVFCGQSFVTHGKMMSHLMKCPKAG